MLKQKIKIVRQFINEDEKNILIEWILNNKGTEAFKYSDHPGTVRKTTRWANPNKGVKYPEVSYQIQNKVDQFVINNFNINKILRVPAFADGMYASIALKGDCCEEHCDPTYVKDHITYHFNIMLSYHDDSKLIVDNQIVGLNATDAILLPVSQISHGTTRLENEMYRMFWCFGYCIPKQLYFCD
jgi:hypothetical protein